MNKMNAGRVALPGIISRKMRYEDFLKQKAVEIPCCGFTFNKAEMNPCLFDWQKDIVAWALRKGKAALFEDCGLGKTIQQLEWCRLISEYTGKPTLIIAPLAVSKQTRREGIKFGYKVNICRSQADVFAGINITNYEMIDHFDLSLFGGVVLDESSILKQYNGKMRNQIIENCCDIPYKLSCTATPAPNDYMELGNQAEFLGVMRRTEMLAEFFVHDGGDTSKWRLKGHAEKDFWLWLTMGYIGRKTELWLQYRHHRKNLEMQDRNGGIECREQRIICKKLRPTRTRELHAKIRLRRSNPARTE